MDDTYSCGERRQTETLNDYRMYDKIWQRVSPELNPYPEVRARSAAAAEGGDGAGSGENTANMSLGRLEQLPGAEANPCCMGSAAMDSLAVVEGFIEDELAGRRLFLRLANRAPGARAAKLLRQIAARKERHMRHLMAAYYLITGKCYVQSVQVPAPAADGFCAALRSAYHEEACTGFNYLRAADATADTCLQKLFHDMGEEAYRSAEQLLRLLSQSMH